MYSRHENAWNRRYSRVLVTGTTESNVTTRLRGRVVQLAFSHLPAPSNLLNKQKNVLEGTSPRPGFKSRCNVLQYIRSLGKPVEPRRLPGIFRDSASRCASKGTSIRDQASKDHPIRHAGIDWPRLRRGVLKAACQRRSPMHQRAGLRTGAAHDLKPPRGASVSALERRKDRTSERSTMGSAPLPVFRGRRSWQQTRHVAAACCVGSERSPGARSRQSRATTQEKLRFRSGETHDAAHWLIIKHGWVLAHRTELVGMICKIPRMVVMQAPGKQESKQKVAEALETQTPKIEPNAAVTYQHHPKTT